MLFELEDRIFNCNKCKRLRDVTHIPMPHIYYNSSLYNVKLFFVGRNPGLEDDYSNVSEQEMMDIYHDRWYKCNFGKYIRSNFGESIVIEKMFFTNVAKCSSPENSQLTEEEMENCSEYLSQQIRIMQPKIIVTFGREAKEIVEKKINRNCPVVNLYHPSYVQGYLKDKSLLNIEKKKIESVKNLT